MIPSKPEKSSRRSSILKLPKVRQPFQTVETNGLSIEDSPPMKLKRRVSFAEKKHVKEFCDSMEQGTVWDNTYEESELSHSKINPPQSTDENLQIQVLSELSNKLNYQSSSHVTADNNLNLFDPCVYHHKTKKVLIRQDAIDLDYLPIEVSCSRLEPSDVDKVISTNPELLANKENIPAVLKISTVESSLIEDEELKFGQKFSNNLKSQRFSVYCDDYMEEETDGNNSLNKTDHQNVSMDMTLSTIDLISSSNIDNPVNENEMNDLIQETDRTRVFNDNAMEMTEAITSIDSPRPNEIQNRMSICQNKSMEITEVVPASHFTMQQSNMRINDLININQVTSSSKIFINQQTMDEDNTKILCPGEFFKDQTQVFHNKSMEMTEAITRRHSGNFCEDRTQVFHNNSMEMTEAITSRFPRNFCEDRTQVFHNKSMEMTEVVPAISSENSFENKTKVFHNNSMEITEAVTSIPSSKYTAHFSEDQTQVFHNKSMEMTEIIPSIRLRECTEDQTELFNNKSMEMTEAVMQRQISPNSIGQLQEDAVNTPNSTEYLQIHCNKNTEVITSLKRQYKRISNTNFDGKCSRNAENLNDNFISQKRQFLEKDAETLHRLLHHNLNESHNESITPPCNPVNYHNESMEITVAVPPHFVNSKNPNNENLSSQNTSMEMTEVIPSFFNDKNSTSNNQGDESIILESEKNNTNSGCDDSIELNQSEVNKTMDNNNFNCSIEQLRFRVSSVSKFPNDEITYNLTAPIPSKTITNAIPNLENFEAPSFLFVDISDELPVFDSEQTNEKDETVPIPQTSFTEEYNQVDNRRRTYTVMRNETEQCNADVHEKINESITDVTNKNLKILSNKVVDEVQGLNVNEQSTGCFNTNSNTNKTIFSDEDLGKRRRTYVVSKNDETSGLERSEIVRSNLSVMNKIVVDRSVDEAAINDSNDCEPTSSPITTIDKQFLSSNTIIKNNISPVKKINTEFAALTENDLIIARIVKQQRINSATMLEKKIAKAAEKQVETDNSSTTKKSMTEEIIKNPYDTLIDNLNEIANKHDCIWEIYLTKPNVIIIKYCMTELLLKIVFNTSENPNEMEIIDTVEIIPRVAKEENLILQITDYLIVKKIDVKILKKNYKTYRDVIQLINYVTNEVNSVFNFYHELKRLSCLNSMKVFEDKISFNVWTKQMNIILKISMNIKPFVDIQSEDIDVRCLLGSVRINDVKDLIKNVKRNYKFLTQYIHDVKDYIELMEISAVKRE